jgi:hypothetical protein
VTFPNHPNVRWAKLPVSREFPEARVSPPEGDGASAVFAGTADGSFLVLPPSEGHLPRLGAGWERVPGSPPAGMGLAPHRIQPDVRGLSLRGKLPCYGRNAITEK